MNLVKHLVRANIRIDCKKVNYNWAVFGNLISCHAMPYRNDDVLTGGVDMFVDGGIKLGLAPAGVT